jgi:hypothetical protein
MINIKPRDIIAIIALVMGFILLAMKIDTVVGGILAVIIGWYFGSKNK